MGGAPKLRFVPFSRSIKDGNLDTAGFVVPTGRLTIADAISPFTRRIAGPFIGAASPKKE